MSKNEQTNDTKNEDMQVETFETALGENRYNLMNLSETEVDLFGQGLISLKQHELQDGEKFKVQRGLCVEMFGKIVQEQEHTRL